MNYLREYVLAGVGGRSAGRDFSVTHTRGGAGVACRTFGGQVIILRVLVREPSCFGFFRKVRKYSYRLIGTHGSFDLKTTILHAHECGNGYL